MRITDQVVGAVKLALEKHAPDEGVEFEVWVGVVPVGPSQMAPALHMIMQVPSPILGEKIMTLTLSQGGLTPSDVEVDQWVTQTLEALRDKRSEVLAAANGKPLPRRATWGDKEDLTWDQALGEG